jgi:hypothetical protein
MRKLTVAAVVPAKDAAATIDRCLAALRGSDRVPDVIVVVDDGSSDDTATRAARHGALVLTNPVAVGPGLARNAAARAVPADLLLFVDADVVVHPDAVGRMEAAFLAEPGLAAAFGSYDDTPPHRNVASLYANLRHHFTHAREVDGTPAATFWTGLGAVRRDAFLEAGGFDPRFAVPSIEDIHLGMRLHAAGRMIRMLPSVRGTHLKHWTFRSVVIVDIVRRAIPWAELIADAGRLPDSLNLRRGERIAALLAAATSAALVLSLLVPWLLAVSLAALSGWLVTQAAFARFLVARLGILRAAGCLAMHFAYYHYASGSLAYVVARRTLAQVFGNAPRNGASGHGCGPVRGEPRTR